MTRIDGWEKRGHSSGAGSNAVGVASACLGLLLLVLSSAPLIGGTGPVRAPRRPALAEVPAAADQTPGSPRLSAGSGQSDAVASEAQPAIPLDINRADGEALQTLPGIGPVLAQRILAYRESHGPFRRPEELMNVPGVGAKRYARLQATVRVAEGP